MTALTGEEKASLLLLCLDSEAVARALSRLRPGDKARLTEQMQRLAASPEREQLLAQVLAEVERLLDRPVEKPALRIAALPESAPATLKLVGQVGEPPRPAPSAPALALAPPPAPEEEAAEDEGDTVAALNAMDAARLVLALDGESPRTVALLLNLLAPEPAGAVFKQLPSELRGAVSVCLTTGARTGPAVARRTAAAVLAKARALPEAAASASADERFKKTAELLRQLERADRTAALSALEQRDAEAAAQVRQWMYRFEDLLLLDGRSTQKVLGEIDAKTLAVALRGAADDIQKKVFDNLSKRARDGLTEEMGLMANPPAGQVQQAQKGMVEVIQRMDQAGELVMLG